LRGGGSNCRKGGERKKKKSGTAKGGVVVQLGGRPVVGLNWHGGRTLSVQRDSVLSTCRIKHCRTGGIKVGWVVFEKREIGVWGKKTRCVTMNRPI